MIEIIYLLFQYMSNALYIIVFLNMMLHLFENDKKINTFLYYALPIILFWALYYFPEYALKHKTIPYYYYFSVLMSVCLIWIFVFLRNRYIIEKLVYYLYYFTVYKCIVFFLGGFIYDHEPTMDHYLYLTLDITTALIPTCTLIFFRKFCLKYPLHNVLTYLKKYQVALLMYCPVSIFVTFQLADPSLTIPHAIFVSISAFLLVFNLPVFYFLYAKIGESNEARVKLGRAFAETSAQLSRYKYTILIEEQAKKERHELKNSYFYIQTLLKEQKYDQIDAFLSKHIGELSDNVSALYTNNTLIDYILNTKLALAQKHHIKTYTEILIPEKLSINEETFCTILLNLLDNAIEASVKEKKPDLQIYMNQKNQYLVCCIKNKVSYNVHEVNPQFHTSKDNASNHGLGMKIIRRAVKEAGGIFDTYMESGYFVASILFPIQS